MSKKPSIFRVFVNAVRVQNFFGTSGRSRSVCCQSFSPVRRLAATKTLKNRNGKKCKLWTDVYPLRMALFGLRIWENAFQLISNIWFFDPQKKFSVENFRPKIFRSPRAALSCSNSLLIIITHFQFSSVFYSFPIQFGFLFISNSVQLNWKWTELEMSWIGNECCVVVTKQKKTKHVWDRHGQNFSEILRNFARKIFYSHVRENKRKS